jgi:hypothetical protein
LGNKYFLKDGHSRLDKPDQAGSTPGESSDGAVEVTLPARIQKMQKTRRSKCGSSWLSFSRNRWFCRSGYDIILQSLCSLLERRQGANLRLQKTGGTMRSIVIPALVGILLLLPSVTFAETFAECQTRCANESASRAASCPRPSFGTDQDRSQCLQAGQDAFNGCITGCQQPAPSDLPADTSVDTHKDAPKDAPADTPQDAPKETPADKPAEN